MKKSILRSSILVVSFLFLSCSKNDDPSTKQDFFNLNVGNTWVYKEYGNNNSDPTQFTFTGIVDTVKIVSIENIQGLKFAKKSTKRVEGSNLIGGETYSYVRVNNLGHLIDIPENYDPATLTESSGVVLHPGFDKNYSNNYDVSFENTGTKVTYGNIAYKAYEPKNILVEGKNYLVSPYNGIFTPSPDQSDLVSKSVEFYYSQNIGLVKSVNPALSGNYIQEMRLVSYKIN